MDAGALLRLVSQPTRHAILDALRQGEAPVGQLARRAETSESNVSHQLRKLRDVGLVAARRDGRHQVYRLAHRDVARLLTQVDAVAERLEDVALTEGLGVARGGFVGYG